MQSFFGADPISKALDAAAPIVDVGPWKQAAVLEIGGLTALGFDRKSEDMLVTSRSGQSVVSGVSGEVLYRNREEDGLDPARLKGTRLDHPADERFDMAGVYGGGLRTMTSDGWSTTALRGHCLLHPPYSSIRYLEPGWDGHTKDATFHLLDKSGEEVRVLGFSWSGHTMVCATSSRLTIWGRPAPLTL